jgi:hypothetical protein
MAQPKQDVKTLTNSIYTETLQSILKRQDKKTGVTTHKDLAFNINTSTISKRISRLKRFKFVISDEKRWRGYHDTTYRINYPGMLQYLYEEVLKGPDKINYNNRALIYALEKYFQWVLIDKDMTPSLNELFNGFLEGIFQHENYESYAVPVKDTSLISEMLTDDVCFRDFEYFVAQVIFYFNEKNKTELNQLSRLIFEDMSR